MKCTIPSRETSRTSSKSGARPTLLGKVYFSDIQRLFPQIRDQILKNGMKETEIEIDRNGICNFNQSKYVPERFKDRMTPEMICQFESACHG